MPDAALVAVPQGAVVAVNEAAVELFGAPDLEGRPLAELLPLAPKPGRGWRPAQARRVNNTPLPVEACASELGDGRLLYGVRALRESAVLEEALRYFDVAFDRSPIGMAVFNTDGEYVRVNAALSELLGRAPEDLLGRRDQELTHPDDRQADLDAAWEILEGRIDTHQTEKRFVRPDGSVVWALANLTFLRDEAGRPLSWVGQFQDVTARRTPGGRAAPPRRPRPADRPAQPPLVRARARAAPRARAPLRRAGRAADDRPRRLQGGQRPARPRDRRRACSPARPSGCARACARATCWRGSAATSSPRCCPPPTAPRPSTSPGSRSRSCATSRRQQGPPVTASVGAAVLAEPELTAHVVQRQADRAMYAAKRAGRDRYVVV